MVVQGRYSRNRTQNGHTKGETMNQTTGATKAKARTISRTAKLSKRLIDSFKLPAGATRADLIDDGFHVRGVRLRLEVGRRGRRWRARVETPKGRKVVTLGFWETDAPGLGLSIDAARDAAVELAVQKARGMDFDAYRPTVKPTPRIDAPLGISLEQAAKAWREWARSPRTKGSPVPNIKTWGDRFRMVEKDVLPVLGAFPLASIKPGDIRPLVKTVANRAPIIANRTRDALSAIFKYAIDEGWTDSNPCEQVKAPTKESDIRKSHRAMSWDETLKVWRSAVDMIEGEDETLRVGALSFVLSLATMQRPEACYSAMWREVEDGWWTIPGNRVAKVDGKDTLVGGQKNGKDFPVWVGSELGRWILDKAQNDTRWLFPSPSNHEGDIPMSAPRRFIRAIRKASGVGDVTLRMARSTAATLAVESAGLDPRDVGLVLHHKVPGTANVTTAYVQSQLRHMIKPSLEAWHSELGRRILFK